ncbi:hypothetical protein LSH36_696g01088 [Paralvinella palmiformis]|uniref:Uncharacterized protein n=1 Tax=Paralvinella palmiformis TaxID=53620 RepID=A0AAD9MV27_9ANNE|nr:hypothetical protein LSH36_696g01088 [Paralvinella palmiformis]
MPGRSFNELKDLTHIDYLNTAQIQAKEENIRRIRNQRLTNEQKVLQDKLEQFYERIEKFKRDSNRNILKATMLYEK